MAIENLEAAFRRALVIRPKVGVPRTRPRLDASWQRGRSLRCRLRRANRRVLRLQRLRVCRGLSCCRPEIRDGRVGAGATHFGAFFARIVRRTLKQSVSTNIAMDRNRRPGGAPSRTRKARPLRSVRPRFASASEWAPAISSPSLTDREPRAHVLR